MKNLKTNQFLQISLALAFLLAITSSCTFAGDGIKGNGNVVKQERDISSFSGLDVGGAFKVFLTQGEKESLVVEADENLLDIIETEVRGNTLKISTSKDINNSKALNIYLTFKDLSEMDISGACQVSGENKFKLGNLDVDCSGASDVTMKLAAEGLTLDCSGASQMDLYGSAESIEMDISGASHLDASDLEAKTCKAEVSGASHGKVFVTGELSAEVSGAGSLKYKGDAVIRNHDVSGAGSLKKI